jgi:hypothetical protein
MSEQGEFIGFCSECGLGVYSDQPRLRGQWHLGCSPYVEREKAERLVSALKWSLNWIEECAEVPVPGTDEQEDWERWEGANEHLKAALHDFLGDESATKS